jgi:hypothetical protein
VWLAPEVRDYTQRLQALDPRLALVQDTNGIWSIWRTPEDGSDSVCIMRAKRPDAKLDPAVIEMLRMRDTRAGHDPVEEIIRHNDRVVKAADDAIEENTNIAFDKMMSRAWKGRVPQTAEGIEAAM